LYIVSAKKPINNATLFVADTSYEKGDKVYITPLQDNIYYECTQDNNETELPIGSNSY
jgi:hypothetical protein